MHDRLVSWRTDFLHQCFLVFCLVLMIAMLSGIVITLSEKRALAGLFFHWFVMCAVHHGLFTLPLSLTGGLYSVLVPLSEHYPDYFP